MYLHDFHKAYAEPPKGAKKIHLAKISSVMNKSIEEIEWTANVTQGWALVTTKKPWRLSCEMKRIVLLVSFPMKI